jgi:PIN domain nuclease of toxin-antitoxin system
MKYLLDTCVFLWVSQQPSMLSKIVAEICNDPANQLFVSDVSVWEVVLKNSAGKLPLPGFRKAGSRKNSSIINSSALRSNMTQFSAAENCPAFIRIPSIASLRRSRLNTA